MTRNNAHTTQKAIPFLDLVIQFNWFLGLRWWFDSPLPPTAGGVLGLAAPVLLLLLLQRGLLGPSQLLHDLVLEVRLVRQDVALPLGHSLLLADPDLVRHLLQREDNQSVLHDIHTWTLRGLDRWDLLPVSTPCCIRSCIMVVWIVWAASNQPMGRFRSYLLPEPDFVRLSTTILFSENPQCTSGCNKVHCIAVSAITKQAAGSLIYIKTGNDAHPTDPYNSQVWQSLVQRQGDVLILRNLWSPTHHACHCLEYADGAPPPFPIFMLHDLPFIVGGWWANPLTFYKMTWHVLHA